VQRVPAVLASLGELTVDGASSGGWRASTLGTVASDAPQVQNGAVGGFSRSQEGQIFTRAMMLLSAVFPYSSSTIGGAKRPSKAVCYRIRLHHMNACHGGLSIGAGILAILIDGSGSTYCIAG